MGFLTPRAMAETKCLPRTRLVFSILRKNAAVIVLAIISSDIIWTAQAARNYKHNLKNGQMGQYSHGINRSLKNGGLFPSVFNVATKADIYVNATCGDDGPETFCKPSESTRCAVCDPNSPDPGKRHNASHALDSNPSRWWQSPTLARGDRYEYVTITLDLKQVYQIAYVIVKAANSPRPAAWILERSIDGENFYPWQYYAPTDEECWTRYSVPPLPGKPTYVSDTEVVCTSSYSRPTPMENGEIHTSLTNGRPGAINHSTELEEFTQARFVRFRFQGLRPMGETIVDKRRAFYSIKEINVAGHCLCSGHASHCRYSVHHGHQECECERHTCGERCHKCCPMFNQVQWRPGTSGRGFHCEKCNCHGHATACRYDQEIANQRSSLDIRDKYRGGGVCINCTEHTMGINCEKCEIGYYRPNGVLPNASEPCLPCTCNIYGSTGFCTPDDSFTRLGKVAGACECKAGYSGYKCDQCAAGYRQFPDCMPCPCDSRGILPSHDCEGDCLCKAYVTGELCDLCKNGYFALTRDNEDGCLQCSCSGVTKNCRSARLTFGMLSTREGWLVTDMNVSRTVAPEVDTESGSLAIDSSALEFSPYWLAPKVYGGNRLTSYGSNLTFVVTWVVMRGDSSGRPTTEPDVVLVGNNGMRIAYGEERYSGQDAVISVPLYERGWYHLKEQIRDIPTRLRRTEFRGDPVTRFQILKILADLKYLLIRAQYHSEQIEGSLLEATLPAGELIESDDDEAGTLVEHCQCPPGYEGLSCEKCAWGYTRVTLNDTDHNDQSKCVKCDCNMHAGSCDLLMGECGICEHNTVGPKCDRCASGYYGDPSQGTPNDCRKCACPLNIESNNFSPICQLDKPGNFDGGYVCTQCPKGYAGDHCESCDIGFFGNPKIPGNTCEPCSCNGGQCDQQSGKCLECRGNTDGWRCERCKDFHYGNPLELDCKPCDCNEIGSSSSGCDSESGQCNCRPRYTGRTCSNCIEGFGNVSAGCVLCNCGIGSAKNICNAITGECECLEGVKGPFCDQCDYQHYGLSPEGCTVEDEPQPQDMSDTTSDESENNSTNDTHNHENHEEPLPNDEQQSANADPESVNSASSHGYSMETLKKVLMLMATKLRHNLTYTATEDIAKLLNIANDDSAKHTSKFYLKQILNKFSAVVSIHHICFSCDHYAGKQVNTNDEKEILCCKFCKTNFSTKKNIDTGTIFLYLSLKEQLKQIMEESGDSTSYRDKRIKHRYFALEDIFDGALYKKMAQNSRHWNDTITMTFSFDGVPIFESSNYSAHPILCMANELPPKERRKNIMMCSVWCGKAKPMVNDYFIPFVTECKELYDHGFDYFYKGQKLNKKCQLIMGICDSVARPMAQQSTQFNGKYGCSLCLHPGKQVAKGRGSVRIYSTDLSGNPYGEGMRTHAESLTHASRRDKGFKARSILCDLLHFDIVFGLPVDYMHCVLLGVCRQLSKLWFDSDNHEQNYYLGAVLSVIDSLLLSYKPTLDVSRTPRKMSERKYWKAHEWLVWLLYYSVPTLKNLLPARYLRHWCVLVEATAILLKTSVSPSEIQRAEDLLLKFVKDMGRLYGEENVSFNVHLLAHLAGSVRDWGPLWSHSAFGFEDFNGEVRKSVKSSRGVPQQICDNFRLKYAVARLRCMCAADLSRDEREYLGNLIKNKQCEPVHNLQTARMVGQGTISRLSREDLLALQRIDVECSQSDDVQYFYRAYVNNELIHARKYLKVHKRASYFVLLRDGELFEIDSFVVLPLNGNQQCFATGRYLKKYNGSLVAGREISHLITLEGVINNLAAINVVSIIEKVIFVEMTGKISAIAGVRPNHVELLA